MIPARKSRTLWRSGRVILTGKDYTAFRWSIYHRAEGRCEIKRNGKRCNRMASWDGIYRGELHHDPKRSQGGSDVPEKVKWACWECHHKRVHPGPQWTRKIA